MLAVVDRENRAVFVDNSMLVRVRSPTLSKLYLGKRAAQGLEAPSRMRCARMNGTCGAPCREGRPTRTSAAILITYLIFPQIVTPSRTEVRFSLCTPRDRLLVKVPRCRAYPLQAFGGRFIIAVIMGSVYRCNRVEVG